MAEIRHKHVWNFERINKGRKWLEPAGLKVLQSQHFRDWGRRIAMSPRTTGAPWWDFVSINKQNKNVLQEFHVLNFYFILGNLYFLKNSAALGTHRPGQPGVGRLTADIHLSFIFSKPNPPALVADPLLWTLLTLCPTQTVLSRSSLLWTPRPTPTTVTHPHSQVSALNT